MARSRVKLKRPVKEITAAAADKLKDLTAAPAEDPVALGARVAALLGLARDARELSLHHSQNLLSKSSASERILDYLLLHVGQEVPGEALDIVSAISEYPRRIREWRVEFGWPIRYEKSRDVYVLERDRPDGEKADLWQKANEIRRSGKAARDQMLDLFLAYPGRKITTAQLRYVTDDKDMRRVRDLRREFGYRIMTRNTGRPDLRGGRNSEYVLVDTEPVEPHDRHIPEKTIIDVLTRDHNRCRKCNWHPANAVAGDPRQYIEVHHVKWHSEGGENVEENLLTLCNFHHKEVHRQKLRDDDLRKWLETKR